DEGLEVLGGVVRERLAEEDAGVIDQHVDRLEARQCRLDDLGGSGRLADMAVHPRDVIRSRDLGGFAHPSRVGHDVETPFDKPIHDSRTDSLRSSGHDGCLPWAAHGCSPPRYVSEPRTPIRSPAPLPNAWRPLIASTITWRARVHQRSSSIT